MTDPHPLLSLPPRELDARLAECMEPKPEPIADTDGYILARQLCGGSLPTTPKRAWVAICDYEAGDGPEWMPRHFSSPSSPRSLLESVEAEIERRELIQEYCEAIEELTDDDQHIPVEMRSWWAVAHAKSNVKAAAAVAVMEPK